MNHNTINDLFNRYINMVYSNPPLKGSIQFQEIRRAFFASWIAALGEMTRVTTTLPMKEATECFKRWHDECRGFVETVVEKEI